MNKRKDDRLIKLIKKVAPENPSEEFTDDVMKQLTINIEQILNADVSFSHLVKQVDDSPHPDFTDTILSAINSKYTFSFKPIFSRKTRWIFATSLFILVLLSFLFNNGQQTITNKVTYNLNFIYEFMAVSSQSLSILFSCIVSLSLLLFADYSLKNRISY